MSPLPDYVEYGPRTTFPPPFLASGGQFLGLVLEGGSEQIDALCERVLNQPAEGKVKYEPLGNLVVMMVGAFERETSQAKEFIDRGYVSETSLVFWLPLRATDAGGNTRLCLSAPFVFVDNELSLLSGREDFGYAKSLAEFCPRNGSGPNVTVRAFGGNFGLNSKADWREVLHIAEVGAVLGTAWGTPQNIAAELVRSAGAAKANLTLFLQKLVEELVEEKARHVFLKQFRDAEIAGKACLRCVVESPVAFTEPSVRLLLGAWEVAVTPLDSQPITTDLGVQTQITPLAFELKMNMLLNPGDVVAP